MRDGYFSRREKNSCGRVAQNKQTSILRREIELRAAGTYAVGHGVQKNIYARSIGRVPQITAVPAIQIHLNASPKLGRPRALV